MYLWKSGGNFIFKLWPYIYWLRHWKWKKRRNLSKWGKFSFYVMVDSEIFTYLKNKKYLIIIVNKKFKIFDFKIEQYILMEFNPLIVWKNPFGVDVRLTEKPGGWLAWARTENCPRLNFWLKMQIFLKCFSSGVFFIFLCSKWINWFLHQ